MSMTRTEHRFTDRLITVLVWAIITVGIGGPLAVATYFAVQHVPATLLELLVGLAVMAVWIGFEGSLVGSREFDDDPYTSMSDEFAALDAADLIDDVGRQLSAWRERESTVA